MLPHDSIEKVAKSGGDRADIVYVKHKSGGVSTIGFKSYDQGRPAFEGTARDYVWGDEEMPLAIYMECLLRTMTTDGIMMLTFTPMLGLSEIVLQFLPSGSLAEKPVQDKYVVQASWDDAPHLTDQMKSEMLAQLPPFQRDARSKGIPQLGSGAIYPVPESEIVVDPFAIPGHFKRYAGMDVGWKTTAVCWFAEDPDTGVHYLFSDYARGSVEPVVHAEAIKSRGKWTVAIDPASRGRTQNDGQQLYEMYSNLGLDLRKADNAVETGLYTVWSLLSEGKLKIFKTCQATLTELRMYRRDEKGHVVKSDDHNMDALRYGIMTGRTFAKALTPPKRKTPDYDLESYAGQGFSG
jgi:phage terminase large subunit-like protein